LRSKADIPGFPSRYPAVITGAIKVKMIVSHISLIIMALDAGLFMKWFTGFIWQILMPAWQLVLSLCPVNRLEG
jgi:hypothetical protein